MSEVEQNIVSVERILHYVKLEPEAPAELPDTDPTNWPTKGEVEFRYVLAICCISVSLMTGSQELLRKIQT